MACHLDAGIALLFLRYYASQPKHICEQDFIRTRILHRRCHLESLKKHSDTEHHSTDMTFLIFRLIMRTK
jgi:hypothetical protein